MPGAFTVSVVLATYNGQSYLVEQLDSYLAQQRLPDELILSDDGSPDRTIDIAREFAMRAPFPVRITSNQYDKGYRGNFQTAIQAARCEVIALSDQDDVWLPAHLARLVESLERDTEVLAVASNSDCVDNTLKPLGYTIRQSERFPERLRRATMRPGADQFELVLRHRAVTGHGIAFRRSLVPAVLPFPESWIHDQWIFLVAAALGRVNYVPDTLSMHRQHGAQAVAAEMKSIATWAKQTHDRSSSSAATEVSRWLELLDRIRSQGASAAAIAKLQEKIEFLAFRAAVRSKPLAARIAGTTASLLRGRYHRLGRGFYAYARDLQG